MNAKMKNISRSEVLTLKEQISYQDGQVVSKTLAQNSAVSITLFSFAKGEEISSHKSDGDAFVTCLDGIGKSPLTERNICFTRGNPSSCRPGTSCGVWTRGLQDAFGRCILSNRGFVSCHPKPIHRPYQCGF